MNICPKLRFIVFTLVLLCTTGLRGQVKIDYDPRIMEIAAMLDSMSRYIPALNKRSDVTFTQVPLHDFVRAVGKSNLINLFIPDTENKYITNDFWNEPVRNIFLFICQQFNFTIEPTGTILRFRELGPSSVPKAVPINIRYENGYLSLDLHDDPVDDVIKKISSLTGEVIISAPGITGNMKGFIPPTKAKKAIEHIFISNGFIAEEDDNGIFFLYPVQGQEKEPNPPRRYRRNNIEISIRGDLITVSAIDASLAELIQSLFTQTGINYFIYDQLEGGITINLKNKKLEEILRFSLQGTAYTYKVDEDVYLIGKKEIKGLNKTSWVKLKYRPITSAVDLIPVKVKDEVEITEYKELNSIIINGQTDKVDQLEEFLARIDQPVPMVKIEMIVVEIDKTRFTSTGVRAGLRVPGDSLAERKAVLPGLDYTLSGPQINDLISSSGIPALGSLGRLSSRFYLQLKAQENLGNLKVNMKPVLSMLNGREATLTIGQTQYYLLDTQTSAAGAINSFNQFTQRFEKIEANITLTITPYISDKDMVTLDVEPDFTTPVGRLDSDVPPTISTRKFDSTIRVKNGETVILGGLSREEKSETTGGIPFLSRIPVLKWFTSNREKTVGNSSLIIYITPVIYYN